jgi:hypothetical protein
MEKRYNKKYIYIYFTSSCSLFIAWRDSDSTVILVIDLISRVGFPSLRHLKQGRVVGWAVRGTPSLATSSIHLFTTVNLVLRYGGKTKALSPNVFHLLSYYLFVQCNCHSCVLFTNKVCQCGQIAHCCRQPLFLWLHYTIIKINEHVNSDLFTQWGCCLTPCWSASM